MEGWGGSCRGQCVTEGWGGGRVGYVMQAGVVCGDVSCKG